MPRDVLLLSRGRLIAADCGGEFVRRHAAAVLAQSQFRAEFARMAAAVPPRFGRMTFIDTSATRSAIESYSRILIHSYNAAFLYALQSLDSSKRLWGMLLIALKARH